MESGLICFEDEMKNIDGAFMIMGCERALIRANFHNLKSVKYVREYLDWIYGKVPIDLSKLVSPHMPQKECELHFAVADNNIDEVQSLISAGADINYQWINPSNNEFTQTPLLAAVALNHFEIAKILLKAGADTNIADNEGQITLHMANSSPTELLDLLLQAGADVNKVDMYGFTPLYHFVREYDEEWSSRYIARIEILLAAGALVNRSDLNGETPLHKAIKDSNVDIVRMLAYPSSVNSINGEGITPLYMAVEYISCFSMEDWGKVIIILFHARCDMLDLSGWLKSYVPEILPDLLADEAFFEWYTKSCNSPDSMKNLCRKVIYRTLFENWNNDFVKKMSYLPLPAMLQVYLSRKLLSAPIDVGFYSYDSSC